MEHTVKVWEKLYQVSTHQNSKTVWIAIGDHEGQRVETKGRTETQALSSWREAARYRGN